LQLGGLAGRKMLPVPGGANVIAAVEPRIVVSFRAARSGQRSTAPANGLPSRSAPPGNRGRCGTVSAPRGWSSLVSRFSEGREEKPKALLSTRRRRKTKGRGHSDGAGSCRIHGCSRSDQPHRHDVTARSDVHDSHRPDFGPSRSAGRECSVGIIDLSWPRGREIEDRAHPAPHSATPSSDRCVFLRKPLTVI